MNWSSFGPVYFAIAPSEGAKTVNSLDKYCDASELCINKFLNWNLKQIDSLVQTPKKCKKLYWNIREIDTS